MVSISEILEEWERVKSLPCSLHKHYKSQSEYQRWHNRFIRLGLIERRSGGWKKQPRDPKAKTDIDNAAYARAWRKNHPGQAKRHVARYWAKKLAGAASPDQ